MPSPDASSNEPVSALSPTITFPSVKEVRIVAVGSTNSTAFGVELTLNSFKPELVKADGVSVSPTNVLDPPPVPRLDHDEPSHTCAVFVVVFQICTRSFAVGVGRVEVV